MHRVGQTRERRRRSFTRKRRQSERLRRRRVDAVRATPRRRVVVVDDARESVRERGGVALRVRAFDAGADGGGDGDPRRYRRLAGQRRALQRAVQRRDQRRSRAKRFLVVFFAAFFFGFRRRSVISTIPFLVSSVFVVLVVLVNVILVVLVEPFPEESSRVSLKQRVRDGDCFLARLHLVWRDSAAGLGFLNHRKHAFADERRRFHGDRADDASLRRGLGLARHDTEQHAENPKPRCAGTFRVRRRPRRLYSDA
mmetsp:Transcript_5059/g.21511  ORF Transcript_5059/g.21511 Transcript_5059/m.21511 type:complete len:254 (-) Transcript_5059:604-1365(-)